METFTEPKELVENPYYQEQRQVNSYALQVEPDRFKHEDKVKLDYKEALYIEKTRNEFFIQLKELLRKHKIEIGPATIYKQ